MRIDNYLDYKKTAKILGVSAQYIYYLIKNKKIKGVYRPTCCNKMMIPKAQVELMLSEHGLSKDQINKKIDSVNE